MVRHRRDKGTVFDYFGCRVSLSELYEIGEPVVSASRSTDFPSSRRDDSEQLTSTLSGLVTGAAR